MLGMMVVQWCVYARRYLRNCLCMYTFVWEYVCMLVCVPAYISVGVSECIYMWSLHVGMWLSVICYATLCKAETDLYTHYQSDCVCCCPELFHITEARQ